MFTALGNVCIPVSSQAHSEQTQPHTISHFHLHAHERVCACIRVSVHSLRRQSISLIAQKQKHRQKRRYTHEKVLRCSRLLRRRVSSGRRRCCRRHTSVDHRAVRGQWQGTVQTGAVGAGRLGGLLQTNARHKGPQLMKKCPMEPHKNERRKVRKFSRRL